jgi:hypothetical protein
VTTSTDRFAALARVDISIVGPPLPSAGL